MSMDDIVNRGIHKKQSEKQVTNVIWNNIMLDDEEEKEEEDNEESAEDEDDEDEEEGADEEYENYNEGDIK